MLNLFRRKPKSRPLSEYTGPARDPLKAIPQVCQGVESRTDPEDHIHLRRVIPPRNRIDRFFLMMTGTDRDFRMEFDDYGTYFWQQIDGRRDLHTIAQAIARKFSLPLEDARAASLQFTRDLMLRHMVQLEVKR